MGNLESVLEATCRLQEVRQFMPFASRQFHMGRERVASRSILRIDQAVAPRIDVGIVDLRGVAEENDFRAFADPRDDRLHFVRRELLRFVEDEKAPRERPRMKASASISIRPHLISRSCGLDLR